jgi:acyl-coenzyme A synthetase/AMP-(fatty) acid ligase
VGGTAVIHQSQPRWRALLQPGLTHCHAIPQMLADILAAPDGAFPRSETMKMIVGGGPLSQALADETRRRITPHLYVNVGSTEVSTFAYTAIETPEDRRWHRPLTDIAVQVVDEEDKPLPSGRVGRVRVSTLAGPDQYLGDAEATAAFFKDGYFYPGDLGMIRDDGRLALHGRVTDVLNIKGNKIAPGPMEDALRVRLGVREVVLFSQQNEAAEEEIHVTIETATPIEPKRLNAALSAEIQGFPSARVHFVRSMPRNVMGKVMRLALREQVLGTPPA